GQEILSQSREDLAERGVAEAIEGLIARLAGLDYVLATKGSEMLGGIGLLDADLFAKLADRQLAAVEILHDSDPSRMRESLGDPRLESPHRIQHGPRPAIKSEYSNYRI